MVAPATSRQVPRRPHALACGLSLGLAIWGLLLPARAQAQSAMHNINGLGTGLGVALGAEFSTTKLLERSLQRTAGNSFSWGFFVDVPLSDTFYLTPAAMLYELNFGTVAQPITDVDLAFKFISPLGPLRLGLGLLGGLSSVETNYFGHVGVLAHAGLLCITNLEAFLQFQYKRFFRDLQDLDNLYGYAGVMFRL